MLSPSSTMHPKSKGIFAKAQAFFLIMKIAGYKLTLSGAGLLRQRGLRFESGIARKKLTRTS